MNADETRETNVTTAVNGFEKQAFENLADTYDCSQAAVSRMAIMRMHREVFGNIHPKAVPSENVDVQALLNGDLEPDDVSDDFKIDGDGPAQIPTADGGISARSTPSSYTPTYTPQDLATTGTELAYDELKDTLKQHWGDSLEIHPDRVRASDDVEFVSEDCEDYSNDPYALKANRATVSKILAGILRTNGGEVPAEVVEDTILEYTSHQITRADEEAGERYKIERYTKLLTERYEYLIPHPDPLTDKYYTSEAAVKEHFGKEVEDTITKLVDQSSWVIDPREHAQREKINPKEDASQWVEDLASFRQRLGFLKAILSDDSQWLDELRGLDDDLFDGHPTAEVAVRKTYNEMLKQYSLVNQWARFAAAHAVHEIGDEDVLEDEVLRDDVFVEVNVDNPAQPMTKWVHQKETPLSPQAQIDAVSDKL